MSATRRLRPLVPLLVLGLVAPALRAEEAGAPAYPSTRATEAKDVLHGVEVPDPYRWLEEDDDPEVVAWDGAQQALLDAWLASGEDLGEIEARVVREMRLGGMRSRPTFRGARTFFTKRPPGANHDVLYVEEAEGAAPRVLIDPNPWSEDGTAGMKRWFPSEDGARVAYERDVKGSEDTTLYVRDVATGEDLPDVLPRTKFTSVEWAPDGKAFLYTRMPAPQDVPPGEAQYHRRVHLHRLGDLPVDDRLVAGMGRPKIEWPWLHRSSDRAHAFLGRERPDDFWDTFEVSWQDDGLPGLDPLLVGHDSRTSIDRVGGRYVLRTDWKAPRGALYTATRQTVGTPEAWTTLLPEQEGVIEGFHLVGERVVVHLKQDVVSRLRVLSLEGKDLGEIRPPGGPGTASAFASRPDAARLWFTFDSYGQPAANVVCDLAVPDFPVQVLDRLPTSLDTEALVSEQHFYESRDGTRVPIFLVRRRDAPLDGTTPVVLYGYGGFRVAIQPRFSRAMALWCELGGAYAVACIRGGDEYGETWHEEGSLGNKQNVFDDFIAAADWLVETGRARRERLAIQGGSNGGLLVAAVANQRPDLCQAVVCGVPLTDMLRYHRFQYAEAWTPEYGNPDDPKAFAWLRAYSPYHNVAEGAAYPAALVTAGIKDGRVNAFHARKIVARWQAATSSDRPILLFVDRESGHGSASVRQFERELTLRLAFLRRVLSGESGAAR